MHIKKGDAVQVIAGKDKGKQAKVIAVLPKENKVVVEGVGIISKHQKPSNIFPDGGIIKKEAPIHASNVQLVDPKTKKPTRVKMDVNKKGEKIRVAVKTGNKIDK